MTAAQVNDLKAKIKAEMARRNSYGALSPGGDYNYAEKDKKSNYASEVYDFVVTPATGSEVLTEHGQKTADLLLRISEHGNLKLVKKGEEIPSSFDASLIEYVNTLAGESMTGTTSSCHGACTGLCTKTCGTGCSGCSGSTAGTSSGSYGCGGCSSTCGSGCESGSKGDVGIGGGSCGGDCTATCGTGCASGSRAGYGYGCLGCSATCGTGCASGSGSNCSGCSTGCSAACSSACSGYCQGGCGNQCAGRCTTVCDSSSKCSCGGSCSSDCQRGCYTQCNGCSSGCQGTCSGTCSSGCSGCNSCSGCQGCTGCGTSCSGECSSGCYGCSGCGGCNKSCGLCDTTCTIECANSCGFGCSTGCNGCSSCGGCSGCSGCSGGCSGQCSSCSGCSGCSSGCTKNCFSACYTSCSTTCWGTCTGTADSIMSMMSTQTLTNLIPDGDFETTNWSRGTRVSDHVAFGSYSRRLDGTTSVAEVTFQSTASIALNHAHIYYASVYIYAPNGSHTYDIYWPIAEPQFIRLNIPIAKKWVRLSYVNNRSSFTDGSYPIRFDYNNGSSAGSAYFDGAMLIDLTASFGAGKEPTKEWCDEHIYFTEGGIIRVVN